MKASVIIPVYFNEENLRPLYRDIKQKFIDKIEFEYELVFINDGSLDRSGAVLQELASEDKNIKVISLSRNFGSHAAMLCGLEKCTGDCAIIKAADLQEPTELLLEMIEKWKAGDNVVLAVREGREEGKGQIAFANLYYWMVRKFALETMPKTGFDVYLLDRKVINVLLSLDERNSALTGQVLWCGFRTGHVCYTRLAREAGKSRWTLKKKIRLVSDTLFSFSTVPIKAVTSVGVLSMAVAAVWAIIVFCLKLAGRIAVGGWTTLFIFNLLSFGIIMFSLGILGEYLWRTFDASRSRPTYIVEDENIPHTAGEEGE